LFKLFLLACLLLFAEETRNITIQLFWALSIASGIVMFTVSSGLQSATANKVISPLRNGQTAGMSGRQSIKYSNLLQTEQKGYFLP
jgi:hypothetical protein